MKKLIYLVLITVFLIATYFVVRLAFPMDASRYPFFVVLILLDFYLWFSIQRKVWKQSKAVRYLISILYWLPLIWLMFLLVIAIYNPIRLWDAGFRTYSLGIVFVAYLSKFFTVVFLLLADLIRLFRHLVKYLKQKKTGKPPQSKGNKITRSKFLVNMGLAAGGLAFSGLLIGMLKWASHFKIRREKIVIKDLPDVFYGLRIVQISDLHLGSWASEEPMKEAVEMINALRPDLVFFTGDMVNFATNEAFAFEDILKGIQSNFGVYAVLGNHDYGDYSSWDSEQDKQENMNQLFAFYERLGWQLLNNSNDILSIGKGQIAIIGVENWSKNARFPRRGDIQKAKQGTENIPVKLLLSHDPSHWSEVIRKKHPDIDVTFSGHTHGFQFGIEFKGFKWSPAQYMYKQWAGLYKNYERNIYLYVNRGTGFIGYPGRVGILPEITLIELVNKP